MFNKLRSVPPTSPPPDPQILGPRGLMPNPKMGSVTREVAKAVKAAKAGSVQFRVDKAGIVHVGIGKVSFSEAQIEDNLRSLMLAISESKPEGLKNKFIKRVIVSSTMGKGIPIETSNVDPSNAKFMLDATAFGS